MAMEALITKQVISFPQLPCQVHALRHPMIVPKFFFPDTSFTVRYPDGPHPKANLITCYFSSTSGPHSSSFHIGILENYTEKVPSEILLVHALVDGEEDEILVFKGQSSSLMRATSPDPGEAVLPPTAVISCIDRMQGPFNPSNPEYIEAGLSLDAFLEFLKSRGF